MGQREIYPKMRFTADESRLTKFALKPWLIVPQWSSRKGFLR